MVDYRFFKVEFFDFKVVVEFVCSVNLVKRFILRREKW